MRVRTPKRAEPTANPQDARVRELRRLRGMVLGTPSPVLFSSDDQAVPQGEEEIGYQNQDGAGGEGAKDKPQGFASEDPGA